MHSSLAQRLFMLLLLVFLYVSTIVLIPRPLYRKYLIYGLVLGGLPELLLVGVFSRVLHWFTWTNIGPADVWGWNATVPISVAFWVMLFLYFLPLRTIYLVPYVALFAAISVGAGQVTKNLGLFKYKPWLDYLLPFVYLAWLTAIAWVFRWQDRIIEKRPVD